MKKLIFLGLLASLALALVAAGPAGLGAPAVNADQPDQAVTLKKCFDPYTGRFVPCNALMNYKYKRGEPRMEKIGAPFRYRDGYYEGWGYKCQSFGVMSAGCYKYYYCIKSYRTPVGCNFKYQY